MPDNRANAARAQAHRARAQAEDAHPKQGFDRCISLTHPILAGTVLDDDAVHDSVAKFVSGMGFKSEKKPTKGCSKEAVHWNSRVTNPIWAKLR